MCNVRRNVHSGLGKRARQVLDLLYRRGSLTAAQLHEEIPELPSYSAARAVLRRLEDLGLALHETREMRYVYLPAVPRHEARTSALRDLVDTFFSGSAIQAMQALVSLDQSALDDEEVRQLRDLIEKAEKRRPQKERKGKA